jgi:nitroreductase
MPDSASYEASSDAPPDSLTPLLRQRESVMVYDREYVIPPEDLRAILEAARWAPSAGNSQPWGFIIGRRGDETHRKIVQVLSAANQAWAPAASVIIITLHQVATDFDHEIAYSDYAMFDLGQAVAHITVQARSMGLQVRQFGGFDHRAANEAFAVPRHWAVTTGIALGLPAPAGVDDEMPDWVRTRARLPRSRLPLEEFVHSGKFGHPADFLSEPPS